MRTHLALRPFVPFGVALVEEVCDDETQDGVTEELERLVVVPLPREGFMGAARVGERSVEEGKVGEAMTEARLEAAELVGPSRRHRSKTTRPPTTVMSTGVVRISRGATRNRSFSKTTRSASFPASRVPLRDSANSAYADPRV